MFLTGEHRIENHGHHKRYRDAVGSENGLEQRREIGEDVTDLSEADANGQAQRRDGDIALGIAGFGNHLESGKDDVAKHHDGAAAKHRLR